MPTQKQVNDFSKEIPGSVDAEDPTKYKFPRITSKRFDGKESYYDIIVRIATGVAKNVKGVKEIEKLTEQFLPIDAKFFDSKELIPEGYYGWYKVMYYAVAESDPGKGQKPTRVYEGKNVGKKNQTNAFTQALRDALSRYNKQIQKSQTNVVEDSSIIVELFPPMLAGGSSEDISAINFAEQKNVRIQPKLNGTRGVSCLNISSVDSIINNNNNININNNNNNNKPPEIVMYTRKRKVIKGMKYIHDEIRTALINLSTTYNIRMRLDGEFYVHGVPLELISGAMRREKGGESSDLKLQYHVFDIFSEDKPEALFNERYEWLTHLRLSITSSNSLIRVVVADEVTSVGEINDIYNQYLKDGFEGAIVRLNREYKYSYNDRRAKWLMKKKPVLDAEFQIIGYEGAEKGKANGWLIFNLRTKGGKTFNLSNFGERGDELRQKMYEDMSKLTPDGRTTFDANYKGKFITVHFDEWSRFGVPLRARTEGIVIRDYE